MTTCNMKVKLGRTQVYLSWTAKNLVKCAAQIMICKALFEFSFLNFPKSVLNMFTLFTTGYVSLEVYCACQVPVFFVGRRVVDHFSFLASFWVISFHSHIIIIFRGIWVSLLLTSLLDCNNKFMNVSRLPGTWVTERGGWWIVWDSIEWNSLSSVPPPLSYVKFFALSVTETYPEKYCPTNGVASLILHIFQVLTFCCLKQCCGSWSDPHWFWCSGSGSRRTKITHKNRKKGKNYMLWMFSF